MPHAHLQNQLMVILVEIITVYLQLFIARRSGKCGAALKHIM